MPLRSEQKKRRGEEKTVFLLVQDGKIALRKRGDTGLLAGLWEFPNVEGNLDKASAHVALSRLGFSADELTPLGTAKHIFTHVEWQMKGYLCFGSGENGDFSFVDEKEFAARAIPSAFRAFTRHAREVLGGKK